MTFSQWRMLWTFYATRWHASVETDRDRGEVSTTTVVLTFILAALAIAVGAIITNKVTSKANAIPTGN